MIKVKNKEHSINLIKQMGLNSMPQSVLDKTDPEGIENFFKKNPAKEYVVRDIFSPMGKYKFVSGLEECLEFLSEDELLEVTPISLRLRKKILDHTQRGRQEFKKKNNQ